MRIAPTPFHKNLATNIKRFRGKASQVEFAKRFGFDRSMINRIENSEQNVTIDTLYKLCRALKVGISELLEK